MSGLHKNRERKGKGFTLTSKRRKAPSSGISPNHKNLLKKLEKDMPNPMTDSFLISCGLILPSDEGARKKVLPNFRQLIDSCRAEEARVEILAQAIIASRMFRPGTRVKVLKEDGTFCECATVQYIRPRYLRSEKRRAGIWRTHVYQDRFRAVIAADDNPKKSFYPWCLHLLEKI